MNKTLKKVLAAIGLISGIICVCWFAHNKYINTFVTPGIKYLSTKNILIAYADRKGETEQLAKYIKNTVGGDILKLEPIVSYPTDENKYLERLKTEKHLKTNVALKNRPLIDKYDIIFIGTPVEIYTMSPVLKSFLKQNDFKGKIVIPFIVYKDGGYGSIVTEMRRLSAHSYFKNAFLKNQNNETPHLENLIRSWINLMEFKRYQLK